MFVYVAPKGFPLKIDRVFGKIKVRSFIRYKGKEKVILYL